MARQQRRWSRKPPKVIELFNGAVRAPYEHDEQVIESEGYTITVCYFDRHDSVKWYWWIRVTGTCQGCMADTVDLGGMRSDASLAYLNEKLRRTFCPLCLSVLSGNIETYEETLQTDDERRVQITQVFTQQGRDPAQLTFVPYGGADRISYAYASHPEIRWVGRAGWIPTWISQTGVPSALKKLNQLARQLNVGLCAHEGFLVFPDIRVLNDRTRADQLARLEELKNHRDRMNPELFISTGDAESATT